MEEKYLEKLKYITLYTGVLGIRNWLEGANFAGLSTKTAHNKFEIMVNEKDVECIAGDFYKVKGKAHISSRDIRFYEECDRQRKIKFGI